MIFLILLGSALIGGFISVWSLNWLIIYQSALLNKDEVVIQKIKIKFGENPAHTLKKRIALGNFLTLISIILIVLLPRLIPIP
jgi:uncharacterized membrane protein YecN with MAPEG domain